MPYFTPKLRETHGKLIIDCCLNPVNSEWSFQRGITFDYIFLPSRAINKRYGLPIFLKQSLITCLVFSKVVVSSRLYSVINFLILFLVDWRIWSSDWSLEVFTKKYKSTKCGSRSVFRKTNQRCCWQTPAFKIIPGSSFRNMPV